MLTALLIIFIGLAPSLVSLWVMRSAQSQASARIAAAQLAVANRPLRNELAMGDRTYIQSLGYSIGDITCEYNAHSNYIRCAVNPAGPCQDCRYYQAKTLDVRGKKI